MMLLNFDILIHLMGWITARRGVWLLMQTCRTLKSAGMPRLFRSPVMLYDHKQFAAFCRFMDASGSTCTRFLRHLMVQTPLLVRAQETGTLKSFVSMLEHAQQLQKLTIGHLADEAQALDPSLLQALTALTGVKDLTISPDASAFIPMLQSLRSPVVKMEINFKRVPVQVAPMSIIQNFSSSLEQLKIAWYPDLFAPDHGAQFPRMTELDIMCMGFLAVDTLIYSFPNLRVLRANSYNLRQLASSPADGEAQRQTNLSSQSRRRWESLDRLEGPLEYLFMLGISCDVGHLSLTLTEYPYDILGADLITAILSATRPKQLSVYMSCNSSKLRYYQIPLDLASEELTHLTLNVAVDIDGNVEMDALEIIEDMVSLLYFLPRLSHLVLRLTWWIEDQNDPASQLFLREVDLEELATEICGVAPVINHIVLEMSTEMRCVYEVVRDEDGEGTLTKLTGEAARKVQGDGIF
ncbi:hypothetical protein PHLCEN_2v310 [Hermanssonia centrifuga]|uniref:F-box domain-containing protein n=1 Tax=Hermanssonia centrifuga TaxID=98765 RepID=A0A2R6S6F2_9APHY|nr:hypothetical protein PHLCEN_2v310 [Hermanssonia centrifuga]